jgi:hypothetical protein
MSQETVCGSHSVLVEAGNMLVLVDGGLNQSMAERISKQYTAKCAEVVELQKVNEALEGALNAKTSELYPSLRAEIQRLQAGREEIVHVLAEVKKDNWLLARENERLRAALEPFQRRVDSLSLSRALGHIGREELWNARHAYEQSSGDSK